MYYSLYKQNQWHSKLENLQRQVHLPTHSKPEKIFTVIFLTAYHIQY